MSESQVHLIINDCLIWKCSVCPKISGSDRSPSGNRLQHNDSEREALMENLHREVWEGLRQGSCDTGSPVAAGKGDHSPLGAEGGGDSDIRAECALGPGGRPHSRRERSSHCQREH